MITPVLLLMGIIFYLVFPSEMLYFGVFELSDNVTPIRLIEGNSINEDIAIFAVETRWDTYGLHATTEISDAFSFANNDVNNSLVLHSAEDIIYVVFENFLPNIRRPEDRVFEPRDTFILKVFYEFEEIEFRVGNQKDFEMEFIFNLTEGYQIHLPIQLSEDIEINNQWGNLTIGIFATPEYNTVDPLAKWYTYCSTCPIEFRTTLNGEPVGAVKNFTLSIGESYANQGYSFVETEVRLSVNPEFQREHFDNLLGATPPSPWTVSPGEEVKLGFAIHHGDYHGNSPQARVDDFVIVGLLNWEQVELNNLPYLLEYSELGVHETIASYFVITAPEKSGYYDFIAFIVANTSEANSFPTADTTVRFTIKVE